nr:MAG TPA: hypothetical protein [Caudoviricetes sp.]
MRILIALLIYLLVLVSGYAWHTALENRVFKHSLEELIEYISESDDGLSD